MSDLGINSEVTGLDGSGVLIGAFDFLRSAKAGYETGDDPPNFSANTIPTGVYFGTGGGMDPANSGNSDPHATNVAQVMIGKIVDGNFGNYIGVAPNAELHTIGAGTNSPDTSALAMNRLATLSGGTVRAINLSYFGPEPSFGEALDGTTHWTEFVDWSAKQHDVLYVVAWGNDANLNERPPTDNFNGITVAASSQMVVGLNNVYTKFADINNEFGDAVGPRTSIDILAPGEEITLLEFGGAVGVRNGTSYAAPHVTGTTALLHQYVGQQLAASNPRFVESRARRHELMKAVMLNSADKLSGVHGSTRTIIIDSVGRDWTDSIAYTSQFQSLDETIGAGHLNAARAVQQIESGEYGPGNVPMIGWDVGRTGGNGDRFEYILDHPVAAGQYIAITLTWDRVVEKTSPGNYTSGDQFFGYNDINDVMANLDLHLMDVNETNVNLSLWSSETLEDNVELIFFQFGEFEAGQYKIVVEHNGGLDALTDFAVTWWYGNPVTPVTGDYDGSGTVDADDYTLWKNAFGGSVTPGTGADGNGDGIVNLADYTVWRDNLGATSALSTQSVPEPSTLLILAVVLGFWIPGQRKMIDNRNRRRLVSSGRAVKLPARTTRQLLHQYNDETRVH
ncbi:S8 family serine peptidase [Aeoliella sp. SH292]|uniref:S8 family serine peptidase n=1 Tax=Aeoliella sp. SH292 TaxID=3454464 RepID=UPI003F96DBC4